jgi:non-canonical poly(A) RNA polymerase PAPD5/7
VQEVYDKKVIHRLVGVQPKTTVMQDDRQPSSIVNSKGGGASVVQSVWEPAERCEDSEEEGHARKRQSSRTVLSREVIDVDADEEESRYEITGKKGRKTREVIDGDTIFTTDEESEDEEREKRKGEQAPVKINRKRAFWASKAGTGPAGLGT